MAWERMGLIDRWSRAGLCCGVVVGVVFLFGLVGCEKRETPDSSSRNGSETAGDGKDVSEAPAVYHTRARVVSIMLAGKPEQSLELEHEPIPGFKDRNGAVVGMNSMVMRFPVVSNIDLGQFVPGDKIELTFEVVFKPKIKWQVTSLSKLAGDTQLNLGKADGAKNAESPSAEPRHEDH